MLSLFLPRRCVHCGEPAKASLSFAKSGPLARYLCENCAHILDHDEPPQPETLRNKFSYAAGFEVASIGVFFTFIAESPVQSLVHSFKYNGMPRLASHLGKMMLAIAPQDWDYVVPVPLHRTRLAERGYNQAEMLAMGLAGKRRVVHATKRTRPTPTQTFLTLPERIENVRGAFALTKAASELTGKHILVVDDVMTTGSTLASVATTLIEARPRSISILALAAAQSL